MDLPGIGSVAIWIAFGLVCWLGYQMFLQNGRMLLRLEALEQRAGTTSAQPGAHPHGLIVGSVAFDFDLPTLDGGRATLSQWRGRRIVLAFVGPHCAFSRTLLPALAALPVEPSAGRPMALIVSTGDREENRRLMAEHGVRCPVLLQDDVEVASLFGVDGTPMGYILDEHGRIASSLAVGTEAVLRLAMPEMPPLPVIPPTAATYGQLDRSPDAVTPVLARSRIVRDGLPAGTLAPAFRLPRLDGGELALDELRGRLVLLVFSDPTCGPCDALMPELERVHRRSTTPQVVMIGRGDPGANRAKATEQGLTFPIALQQRWEVSRAYGMFATPIGYLIDADGVIASDVAVGADGILNLATRSVEGKQSAWSSVS